MDNHNDFNKGIKDTERVTKGATKVAIQAGKKAAKTILKLGDKALYVVAAIILLILLIVIVEGLSQSQLEETLSLSDTSAQEDIWAKPDWAKDGKLDENFGTLFDKKESQKDTEELLKLLSSMKTLSHTGVTDKIRTTSESYEADVTETLSNTKNVSGEVYIRIPDITPGGIEKTDLNKDNFGDDLLKPGKDLAGELTDEVNKKQTETQNEVNRDSGKVIQTFDLGNTSQVNRSKFSYEHFYIEWASASKQGELFAKYKDRFYASAFPDDRVVMLPYDDKTKDFLCALGSFFGDTGNRYRITFKNGNVLTFLKFDAKSDKDTTKASNHMIATNDGILELLVNQSTLSAQAKREGNLHSVDGISIDEIVKIELIEGTMSSNFSRSLSSNDFKLLAALSIASGNGKLYSREGKLVDISGNEIPEEAIDDSGHKIDYKKLLKIYIDKYLEVHPEGAHTVTFAKNDSEGFVFEKEITVKTTNEKGEPIIKQEVIKYLKPVISEKNTDDIIREMFGINLEDKYVEHYDNNAKSVSPSTYRKMIETTAINTQNLLFGNNIPVAQANIRNYGIGAFALPLPLTMEEFESKITAGFFHTDNEYHSAGHGAIDIGVPEGTPILAAESGTITYAQADEYGGIGIVIDHGNGMKTKYWHIQPGGILVSIGQFVKKGQQIALSGNTGLSTGPHLHFALEMNDTKVDPSPLLGFDHPLGG